MQAVVNSKNKVFLVGMPGSGKTTLGKALAVHLTFSFIDMDEAIEKEQGESIASVFETKGEAVFRAMEKKVLEQICQSSEALVVATGGGVPCFFENMNLINRSGISIFINPALEDIASRMEQAEIEKRPLLKRGKVPVLPQLIEKYKTREKYYKKAGLILTGKESPDQIAEMVRQELKKASGTC